MSLCSNLHDRLKSFSVFNLNVFMNTYDWLVTVEAFEVKH